MILDKILELLAKRMCKAASNDDLAELRRLLEQYPYHQHLVSILQAMQAKKLKQPDQNEKLIIKESWEKLQEKLNGISEFEEAASSGDTAGAGSLFKGAPFLLMAAMVTGLVIISGIVYQFTGKEVSGPGTAALIKESVSPGQPGMKMLPDGSTIWMNAGTKISFTLEENVRKVFLEGEAYFKVKHDSEHPFVVHAGNVSIEALGTEFNVLAYPGENKVETTLIRGKVQVTMTETPDQKIILEPKEKLTVKNKMADARNTQVQKEISYEVRTISDLPDAKQAGELLWMQDKIAFQNESFFSLSKRLERRYDVHIIFQDKNLKDESLSGVFKNETIKKAMQILQMTTPFQFQIKSDTVFLSRP